MTLIRLCAGDPEALRVMSARGTLIQVGPEEVKMIAVTTLRANTIKHSVPNTTAQEHHAAHVGQAGEHRRCKGAFMVSAIATHTDEVGNACHDRAQGPAGHTLSADNKGKWVAAGEHKAVGARHPVYDTNTQLWPMP